MNKRNGGSSEEPASFQWSGGICCVFTDLFLTWVQSPCGVVSCSKIPCAGASRLAIYRAVWRTSRGLVRTPRETSSLRPVCDADMDGWRDVTHVYVAERTPDTFSSGLAERSSHFGRERVQITGTTLFPNQRWLIISEGFRPNSNRACPSTQIVAPKIKMYDFQNGSVQQASWYHVIFCNPLYILVET